MATQVGPRIILRFGTFEVDLNSSRLSKGGIPIRLQDKPFQILALLLEHPGELVLREELQEKLWPNGTHVDFDKNLNTAVKKLRQALGDSSDAPVFVETLPRRGYRFIAPVSAFENKANGQSPQASYPHHPTEAVAEAKGPVPDQVAIPSVRSTFWSAQLKRSFLIFLLFLVAVTITISFVRYKTLRTDHAFNLETLHFMRLTDNGKIRQIAISPNGQYVAYASQDGLDQSLNLKEVSNGSEVQLLAPDTVNFSGLSFSPDGSFLYFIRSEKTNPVFSYLCRMPATGGPVQQLIRDADSTVSFSPDHKQFVYTRGDPPHNLTEIRIANSDGSGDHLLLSISGDQVDEAGATWSPNNDVIAVPLHFFSQSRYVLDLISLAGGHLRELYSSHGAIGRPLWTTSGRDLLVTLEDPASHHGQLWAISYPDAKAHRFTNDLSDYSAAVDITADRATLASIVSSNVSSLWSAPVSDLSHASQITSGEPSFFYVRELPDGRLVASGETAWTMNFDGTHRIRFPQAKDSQSIEVCGRSLLILSNTAGTEILSRVEVDGSNPTALTSGGDIFSPACSPDGSFAYFLNYTHPEKVWRQAMAGGSPRPVADVLGDTLFGALTVSPDGRFLAYPYQQYSPPFVALAVISERGGPAQKQFKVPGFVGALRWSPEGTALQYLITRNDATNLWEQPLQGGEPKQITQFNTGRIFDFTWTRDRKHLLLARGQSTRDVVLITGLGND
jgi:DNA-binding winged helix-turn-helix (wHTH) protein/Tol biopolymer transport system component